MKTIPSDPGAAQSAYPWIVFEGRWGELQKAFFNGPTGPNMKGQWTHPIESSRDWRNQGYTVPAGGLLGTAPPTSAAAASPGDRRARAPAPQSRR